MLRFDEGSMQASFSVAFNLASQAGEFGESAILVCRREKFKAMSAGSVPSKIVVGDDLTEEILGSTSTFVAETEMKEAWKAHFSKSQMPVWTVEELSKVSTIFVETLDDLIEFLSCVHTWKQKMPSLIIIDDLYSYMDVRSEGRESSDVNVGLRVATHIEDVLVHLQESFKEQVFPKYNEDDSQSDKNLRKALYLASSKGLGSAITAEESVSLLEARRMLTPPGVALLLCENKKHEQFLSPLVHALRIRNDATFHSSSPGEVTVSVTLSKSRELSRQQDVQVMSRNEVVQNTNVKKTCVLKASTQSWLDGEVSFGSMCVSK